MTGFWVLMRKELLEHRRSGKFLAMVAVLSIPAVLAPTIFAIVTDVRDDAHALELAIDALEGVAGIITGLGIFMSIIVTMGLLAGERASGTAAMTLSKPVTRAAFVAAKALAVALSILIAVTVASVIAYLLVLLLFANGGLDRFAAGMAVNAGFLLFIGAVAFFWSAVLTRQMAAGGITFATSIVLSVLRGFQGAERYLPVVSSDWARSIIGRDTSDQWPGFVIACGCAVLLPVASWVVFRYKEL